MEAKIESVIEDLTISAFELTPQQQKLLLYIISKINHTTPPKNKFTLYELCTNSKVKKDINSIDNIKEIIKTMKGVKIHTTEDKKSYICCGWIDRCAMNIADNNFTFEFSPTIKPLMPIIETVLTTILSQE